MPAFEYEALDAGGRARRGLVSAETPRAARRELRRQNLTPVSISTPRETRGGSGRGGPMRLSPTELVIATRQLAVLVGASMPLEEALNAVALQSPRAGARNRLLSVRERVIEGRRFADGLADDPKSFPEVYRAVVAAGESSGDLGSVLDRLATMLEKTRAMRNKAIASLIYPIALALVATGVVTALMTQVVPKIVEQFNAFDAELPLVTQVVVAISGFLSSNGLLIFLGLAALVGGALQARRTPRVRLALDRATLGIPVLGRLVRGYDGAQFARTLSTLFAGGAPLLDSLAGAQRTVTNMFIRTRIEGAVTQVREGTSLAAALRRADALPPMMVHMLAAGERAGQVPLMLDKAAQQLEDEFDNATTVALRLLEPAIIILMGFVVAMIVLAIMLPILRLNNLAGA